MQNKPITHITYQCHISNKDIKTFMDVFFNSGTHTNIDFCVYENNYYETRVYVSLTSSMPSFCFEPKDSLTVMVHIGTVVKKYALISQDDISKSIQEIKDAIKAVIKEQKIIPENSLEIIFEEEPSYSRDFNHELGDELSKS